MKFNAEETELLQRLDMLLRRKGVKDALEPIVALVQERLAEQPESGMAWAPVPLDLYAGASTPLRLE